MQKLNERINASGIKKAYIAKKLGISRQAFYKRLEGKTPFKLEEALIVSHILHLTNDEFFYFFARKVEDRRNLDEESA